MKAIVILIDSLNRRFLPLYGNRSMQNPNLDRIAERSVVFTNHWAGSAPCMPARRELFTGRLNFLERNWGPIEPFDHPLQELLRGQGVFTHIVTDHYHYFETGGENYCQLFDTWELLRGQEHDPWVSRVVGPPAPEHYGRYVPQYDKNRSRFRTEADFSTPRTFQAAAAWLEDNGRADNWLLWVEVFDPHEPFDVPEDYLRAAGDDYRGPLYYWPQYAEADVPQHALEHLRRRYTALLMMTDRWLGRLIDAIDAQGLWEDTLVVLATDHGFMLGEHGFLGKNYMPAYNEVFHIPLLIHRPGQPSGRQVSTAMTQNVDLFPTLLEHFAVPVERCRNRLHGGSLLALVRGDAGTARSQALFGYFGRSVNLVEGRYTYLRAPAREDNSPLNLYTAMPTTLWQYLGTAALSDPGRIQTGCFLKYSDFPVYRIPASIIKAREKSLAFAERGKYLARSLLFDIQEDYGQNRPITDRAVEDRCIHSLREALRRHDSPEEQFERLGL